jgi:hypothetical protein
LIRGWLTYDFKNRGNNLLNLKKKNTSTINYNSIVLEYCG